MSATGITPRGTVKVGWAGQDAGFWQRTPRPVVRRWVAPFAGVALAAQILASALPGTRSGAAFAASCGVLVLAIGLALALPRLGAPSWAQLLAPGCYLIAVGLLFKAQGSVSTGIQPLVLLPITWAALYHRPRESIVLLAGAVAMLALASWIDHTGTIVILRSAGVWGLTGAVIVVGAQSLRRWLGEAIDEREEALRQARLLGSVARELNSTLDPQSVVSTAVRLAAEICSPEGLHARRANYCQITDGCARVSAEFDAQGEWAGACWPLAEHPFIAKAVTERVATSGRLDPALLGPTVRQLAAEQGVGHGAWVPVVVDGGLHGVLAVAGRNRPLSDSELSCCVAIVQVMELALSNALAHEQARLTAQTDPLTSLANRRGMEQLVRERRGEQPMAVMAIDVDGLKEVNDRHGHAAGDQLLLLVARAIGSVSRAGDVVARVGGDEFVSVVFDTAEQAGVRQAAKILEAVRGFPQTDPAPRLSIGIALARFGEPLGDAIRRADAAMYAAKRAGGMRYRLAPEGPVVNGAVIDMARAEIAPQR